MALDLVCIESGEMCHVVLLENAYNGKTERIWNIGRNWFSTAVSHDLIYMPHNVCLVVFVQRASLELTPDVQFHGCQ